MTDCWEVKAVWIPRISCSTLADTDLSLGYFYKVINGKLHMFDTLLLGEVFLLWASVAAFFHLFDFKICFCNNYDHSFNCVLKWVFFDWNYFPMPILRPKRVHADSNRPTVSTSSSLVALSHLSMRPPPPPPTCPQIHPSPTLEPTHTTKPHFASITVVHTHISLMKTLQREWVVVALRFDITHTLFT